LNGVQDFNMAMKISKMTMDGWLTAIQTPNMIETV
jgi:hypothetical protein